MPPPRPPLSALFRFDARTEQSITQRIGFYARFYKQGISQLFQNRKQARMLSRMDRPLTRSEFRLVHHANQDVRKLVPFLFILLIVPESIPFLLVFAPGTVPSTCVLPEQNASRRKKIVEKRDALSESVCEVVKRDLEGVYTVEDFIQKDAILGLSREHSKDFSLEMATEQQLKAYARYLGLSAFGPKFWVKRRLERHFEFIDHDDAHLGQSPTVVETLLVPELTEAMEERGMTVINASSEASMRASLLEWLALRGYPVDTPETVSRRPPEERVPFLLLTLTRMIQHGQYRQNKVE